VGEAHFVCLFKGDAMTMLAAIAAKRRLMRLAIPMACLAHEDIELGILEIINREQRRLL
jgi:hypothetical protein